jgi:hypothetical protein
MMVLRQRFAPLEATTLFGWKPPLCLAGNPLYFGSHLAQRQWPFGEIRAETFMMPNNTTDCTATTLPPPGLKKLATNPAIQTYLYSRTRPTECCCPNLGALATSDGAGALRWSTRISLYVQAGCLRTRKEDKMGRLDGEPSRSVTVAPRCIIRRSLCLDHLSALILGFTTKNMPDYAVTQQRVCEKCAVGKLCGSEQCHDSRELMS